MHANPFFASESMVKLLSEIHDHNKAYPETSDHELNDKTLKHLVKELNRPKY